MNKNQILVGAGVALGLLYWASSSRASEQAEPEATEMAPTKIVALLTKARYQIVHIKNPAYNAILATTGIGDGEPSAYDWVKIEQSSGRSVIVSKDIKTAIEVGSVVLSIAEELADEYVRDLKTYYKIPVLP